MTLNKLLEYLTEIKEKHGDMEVLLFDTGRMPNYSSITDKNIVDFYFPFKEHIKIIKTINKDVLVLIDKKIIRLSKSYNKEEYKNLIKQLV